VNKTLPRSAPKGAPRKSKGNDAQIITGDVWRQFAFPQDDIEFLGVIRRGIEIGALAQDRNGAYLQVNGDMRQVLNKSRITALLRSARASKTPVQLVRQPTEAERSAVKVVIKPRRRVVLPDKGPASGGDLPG
jgi:hypothetical protein